MYDHFISFLGLVRYVSPKDNQTLLHRAAEGCQPDNVTLLLNMDEELANIQDNYGNTALQIACTKAHKPTVKAFLVRPQQEMLACLHGYVLIVGDLAGIVHGLHNKYAVCVGCLVYAVRA